jgi:hypothetical protein
VPSPIYSFSYALKPDWSALFGSQSEIQHYLSNVAVEFGIEPLIRFNTEVAAADFDDATGTWTVRTKAGDSVTADILILATGQLSRPRFQFYDANGRVNLEIVAERGLWNMSENSWQLFNGESVVWPSNRQYGANIISHFVEMSAQAPGPHTLKSQSLNLTLQQHLAHGDYEVVSLFKLWRYRRQLVNELHRRSQPVTPGQRQLVSSITFGIHDKIATPLLCLALVLAGAPLGVRPQRASGFSMGISLCVLLLYYAVWTWASTMGASGALNPVVMAYLALATVVLAGSVLLWRKTRI